MSEHQEQVCDICAQNVPGPERQKIFAFGKCDHRVCYVCSARLRVICDQSDCPICREKLDTVIFSSNRKICYEKFNVKNCLYNEKYRIYFESKAISEAFDKLLKYECLKCSESSKLPKRKAESESAKNEKSRPNSALDNESPSKANKQQQAKRGSKQTGKEVQTNAQNSNDDEAATPAVSSQGDDSSIHQATKKSNNISNPTERIEKDSQGLLKSSNVSETVFNDVFGLKNHLKYVHKLLLCDLCLTHNKLFPFEYSYYDHASLRKHMKDGEPKTSHRGHPNCPLCHQTFFNWDELLAHMSREHYHCHLCGRSNPTERMYFLDYDSLRNHFKNRHFLCERDDCRHEQFTSAFDNECEFRLHLVQVHDHASGAQSRGEARQQRTITLDPTPHRPRGNSPSFSSRRNLPPNAVIVSTGTVATANSARQQRPGSTVAPIPDRQQRLPTSAEFPALGNNPSILTSRQSTQTTPVTYNSQYPSLGQTTNNRPATAASSSAPLSQRLVAGPSSSRGSFVRTLGGGYRAAEQLNEMDFPPLPEQPKPKTKKKPKTNQNQGASSRNDNGAMTLDQLISASLTLSNRNTKFNGKKSGPKASKNVKQKSLKIQLS